MTKVEPKVEDEPRETEQKNNYRRKVEKPRRNGRGNNDSTFQGDHEELQGFVYTYDTLARANQFDKTTEKVGQWVKKNLSFNMDIFNSIKNLEEPDTEKWKPKVPEEGSADKAYFAEEVKEFMLRRRTYNNNRSNVYTVVLGQCSEPLKAKLEAQDDWETINNEHDLVKLLKSIKVWMLNQQSTKNPVVAAYGSIIAMTRVRQGRYESLIEYRKRFVAAAQVLDHIEIDMGAALRKIVGTTLENDDQTTRDLASAEQIKTAEKKARQKLLAVAFISGADRPRYQEAEADLENDYLKGVDRYPADVTAAYNRLMGWTKSNGVKESPYNDGISFPQGSEGPSKKGSGDRQNDLCYNCGKKGHHAWEKKCDNDDNEQTMNIMGSKAAELTVTGGPGRAGAGDGQPGDDKDEEYEFAFCTAKEDDDTIDSGQLLSQDGGVAEGVRTSSFSRKRGYVIPKGSVGLDSMSSVDVFGERALLTNIRTVSDSMRIVCNAGTVVVTQMGTFKGYGDVWFHPEAIANILSLNNVQKQFRVTYDSADGDQFAVHKEDGSARVFTPTERGLYVSQVTGTKRKIMMMNTVRENMKSYTKREVRRAEEARRLMTIIGRPSEQQMKRILDERQLKDCVIKGQDIINARNIFGPDVGSLKGKTTRRKEPHVELMTRPIPEDILQRHREVTVCFDIMFVNGTPYLVSISRAIKFCTAEALENRRSETLLEGLRRIKATYARRGFLMNRAAGDNEFANLEAGLSGMGVALNTVAADEHVPEIERHIRTLKERCRAAYNALPFRKMPSRMMVELVYAMTFWIHAFPAIDGVSAAISPRELITGVNINAARHCVIPFGAYVQTHEPHDNSMESRTTGAIALRPTGNAQGGHYFFNLQTGRRISRNHWTEIPTPVEAIERVNRMAESSATNRLTFGNRKNVEVDDEEAQADSDNESCEEAGTDASIDDDSSEADESVRDDEEAHDVRWDEREVPGDEPEEEERQREAVVKEEEQEEEWLPHEESEPDAHNEGGDEASETSPSHEPGLMDEAQAASAGGKIEGAQNKNDSAHTHTNNDAGQSDNGAASAGVSLEEELNRRYGAERPGTRKHNLRPRRRPDFDPSACVQAGVAIAPRFDATRLASLDGSLEPLLNVVMTQYGVRKGLKIFGERGDEAVRAEMKQLHMREVMNPLSGAALTRSIRSAALNYLMFLKQKRDGTIKGRGCADGRKQRGKVAKIEASSPTVSTEALFLVIIIAAREQRDIASVDVPGAFLQTYLKGEQMYIKFEGRMAELLAMIDPKLYRKHIIVENGKPIMYAVLRKALYGMLQSALQFWQQISTDLIENGYVINEYDWCVANKIVNGKQHTICWHVDDFLFTHEDPKVNDELIEWFTAKYGKLNPLSVTRGKVHDYLGMTLDFTVNGKVKVLMLDYIDRMLGEAPNEFQGTASTPAANHLFALDESSPRLDDARATQFHHIVAKSLFLCKRARPDLQLTVGFLSTRVRNSTEDDWRKLRRMIQYLRGSSTLALTLEADGSHIVKWWIDAAFAVHGDMRSQSGGAMSLGKGMAYSSTTRQKLNTRSSTEAELVGVHDFMPQVLWTRYFLEQQGYALEDNVVHQDNQSAMLLANNGKASSSKRTRHINIRFFFVTDRIGSGEVSLQHCPTGAMIGDFFTKPLQGAKFYEFRKLVLNLQD